MGEEDRILKRWAQFYGEKHNKVEPAHETDSIVSVKPTAEFPSIQEVKKVLASLKCSEEPERDSIPAEFFKY